VVAIRGCYKEGRKENWMEVIVILTHHDTCRDG